MYYKVINHVKKTILCIILTLCMMFSGLIIPAPLISQAANSYGLASNIQDGVILHCFNWKYNDIKNELPNIAASGFTSVQTSPAQPSVNSGIWYWLYQPLGFYVGTNDLGTKDELRALCQEAEKYDIKVIVDVVANHLAGNHSNIQNNLKDGQYWHNYGSVTSWTDRYQVTHGDIGMPDLNSEHNYVYECVGNYINELKGLGVDGIRWDAAKHISLPSEGCNFWPAVTNKGLYNYGEILVGPDDRTTGNEGLMKEYTNYMTVTDSTYAKTLRDSFASGTAPTSFGNWSARGISNDKLIYWGESHDTWSNNQDWGYSNGMSQNVIDRAYAVAASRNDITALYFSRPSSANKENIRAGQKGSTHFTSKEVAEVNKFHNAMDGQPDYYTTGNNCSVISRQTGAVVVAGSGGNFNVTVPNGGGITQPGTYVEAITGEKWNVTSDSMSGKIGSSGIAVLYKEGTNPDAGSGSGSVIEPGKLTTGNVYFKNTKNWNDVYAYYWSDENLKMTSWPGVKMTDVGDNTYRVNVPGATKIIFNNGNDSQTDDLALAGDNKIYNNGNWSDYGHSGSETEPEQPGEPTDSNIFYKNTNNWNSVYAYYWSDKDTQMTTWPGVKMTSEGDNAYGTKIPSDADYIIFNNGNDAKTGDLKLSGLNKIYNNGNWSDYRDSGSETEPEQPGEPTDSNIFYKNTNNWNSVYAYYWSDKDTQMTTWPGVKMTSEGDNAYGTKIPSDADYIIFNNGNDAKTGDLKLSGLNKIYNNGNWSDYRDSGSVTKPDTQTGNYIYYKNTKNWGNVYAYYWSSSDSKMTTWPGVKMTNVGSGIYKIEVPSNADFIIFNNGNGEQTGDLTLNGMEKVYDNGNWSNY